MNRKNNIIKWNLQSILKLIVTLLICNYLLISTAFPQCQPFIKIDGKNLIANETVPAGIKLPVWLTSGQTLACGLTIEAISIIEFSENATSLEYSKVIAFTSQVPVDVPTGKVWKIESILKRPIISGGTNKVEFTMAGTNSFTVPACAEYICIEVWGAGGGGQGGNNTSAPGGGGGGGGYGQGCFTVTPGTNYNVTIGAGGNGGSAGGSVGGNGGTSQVGTLISASGGSGGVLSGGAGGTSTADINISGFKGTAGVGGSNPPLTGSGGDGGNGGKGGLGSYANADGNPGTSPGGGGAGGGYYNGNKNGGRGADGKVIITW